MIAKIIFLFFLQLFLSIFSYQHPDNQEVAREYGKIIRKLPVPAMKKIRERDIHIMTGRKYDAKKDKMYNMDKRKQNGEKSIKKKNISWLHLERQIARWIELHTDIVINR